MRLWSIHPRYLDTKGLVALWREGLLAQHVLLGLTKGYRQHPQLLRFRTAADPIPAIGVYLAAVASEADRRGYNFDRSKIARIETCPQIEVGRGQLDYEWAHLLEKLKGRARGDYEKCRMISSPEAHPAFRVTAGGIEHWERV